jgi:lipopolysaccharide heptosyltransferase I
MSKEPKKILIIKPSALGDIVHTLPVLSVLRKSYPDAGILWLVRTEFAPLLRGHPYLNDIILFDRKFLGTAWKSPKALGALLKLIRRLRKEKFDLIVDLQGLFRTASLGWLSGCKIRFGPRSKREFSHFFYTKTIKQDSTCTHVVDYYLRIAEAAGVVGGDVEFVLPTNTKVDKSIRQLLGRDVADGKNFAVLIPGSAHADKCWAAENFAALADRISERYGLSVITVGTQGEGSIGDEIEAQANVPVINMAGKTDIPMLVELLRKAKLVVSNDTGPGQIAVALHVPLVMIFGRSNPARFAPYGLPQCVAAINAFGRGHAINNFENKYHIGHVTVDEVFEKASTQLQQNR